ncbi:TetR/AcrR family transcriptional regulator [Saccharothrix sp. 6-C]|uniref:TetR/AcrR family transcriptional regulator n=1 Tax=Saccharothrix sp. 6-C TaxID=2781735 RepID=UPI0019177E00|nr:TetR/AcrR family transcriptional regulator [Saccharothrix sp. 6-C]QQQ73728.1 TetR/AcrR family transcriptional regulator [Saccharothrix sp. 6-C]
MTVPRRSDALRNRASIIRAAEELVLRGTTPSPARIARLTGLGQATVYRHFPDRRTLLLTVAREHLGLLVEAAERDADDPAAFRALLQAVMAYQVSMRPLVDALRRFPEPDRRGHVRRLLDVLRGPFDRSRAAGHLRHDIVLDDVVVVLTMLQAAVDLTPDPRRAIPVLLDGLFLPEPDRAAGSVRR